MNQFVQTKYILRQVTAKNQKEIWAFQSAMEELAKDHTCSGRKSNTSHTVGT
jgi:hypothetical protein